ncbi:MAG: hypothetical protein FJX59_12535 [Alphaproteobacteria bacterium]|nr:hypothetical protein [Alphaproteobacteria bacterium]
MTFLEFSDFLSAMSPKRLELLRALRIEGPLSVRKLSALVERDYKSVHQDVDRLIGAGLVVYTEDRRVNVPWRKAIAELDLAA